MVRVRVLTELRRCFTLHMSNSSRTAALFRVGMSIGSAQLANVAHEEAEHLKQNETPEISSVELVDRSKSRTVCQMYGDYCLHI